MLLLLLLLLLSAYLLNYISKFFLINGVIPITVLQCSQALAAAVCSANESSGCIVPRLLFLDSYFSCQDKSNWNWPNGVKIHVMGSLILELVFKFPSVRFLSFLTSVLNLSAQWYF